MDYVIDVHIYSGMSLSVTCTKSEEARPQRSEAQRQTNPLTANGFHTANKCRVI